jgi:hypothetical protein
MTSVDPPALATETAVRSRHRESDRFDEERRSTEMLGGRHDDVEFETDVLIPIGARGGLEELLGEGPPRRPSRGGTNM